MSLRTILLLSGLVGLTLSQPATGAPRAAARHVGAGLERYRDQQFEAAAAEFAAAREADPEDLRIAYDEGCALLAADKGDEAIRRFDESKLSPDPKIAADSWYNLGAIAARQARSVLGNDPVAAEPAQRAEALQHLADATDRYRGALAVDPQHEPARHNLELVRLWTERMEGVWNSRDRQTRRDQLGLLEHLDWFTTEQQSLRAKVRQEMQTDDSPRQRAALRALADEQRTLAEEIEPISKKIAETMRRESGRSEDPLASHASKVARSIGEAAEDLSNRKLIDAHTAQSKVLDDLNHWYRAVVPFPPLLQRSIARQQALLEPSGADADPWRQADGVEMQRRVASWAEALGPKAQLQLDAMAREPAVAGPAPPPSNSGSGANDPVAQREALTRTFEKAVELGPQAFAEATQAADQMAAKKSDAARPHQERTLELLREIAESLPPPPQDSNSQDQQQDQNQNQDPKQSQNSPSSDSQQKSSDPSADSKDSSQDSERRDDSKQKQEGKRDESKSPDPKKKPKSDEPGGEKKDDSAKSKEKREDEARPKDRKASPADPNHARDSATGDSQEAGDPLTMSPEELSQQRAEMLLRRVREREREYRERVKRRAVGNGAPVEKDW